MLICLSGRYTDQELALHFGKLPPAFLPLGNERLFKVQIREFGQTGAVLLSLPSDFELSPLDQEYLDTNDVQVVLTDPGMSLCEAIRSLLHLVPEGENVQILFGDTLVEFDAAVRSSDFVAVHKTTDDYPWLYAEDNLGSVRFCTDNLGSETQSNSAVCGYFSFSNLDVLKRAFQSSTLEDALNMYAAERSLQLVEARKWYDFGHLSLFYQSKRDLLVARAFNSLRSDGYSIVKTSSQTQKIRAEAEWYERLPADIILHTPRYISRVNERNKAGYRLEYLYLPTLSEMSVFGRISAPSWTNVLDKCVQLLVKFRDIRPCREAPEASASFAKQFYQDIFVDKTWVRLESFCLENGFNLQTRFHLNGLQLPTMQTIVQNVLNKIDCSTPEDICFWHGDFFFGNLFFDFNTQRIVMIDPRGQLSDGTFSHVGDYRYDLGKLAHSILGGYDRIIAGGATVRVVETTQLDFQIDGYDNQHDQLFRRLFLQMAHNCFGLESDTIYALAALNFFSMLPLHRESPERQMQLLAAGLSLYVQSIGEGS